MIKIEYSLCKTIFICVIFGMWTLAALGQRQAPASDFWSNVRFGGGIGIGFGSNTFNAALAPSAIYQANEYVAFGLGASFNYSKFRDSKLTAYGASILSLFNPVRPIQLSAEFEELRVNREFDINGTILKDNYWSPALFLGVGYSSGPVTIGVRYDVLYDDGKSIYADPWMPFVRVYF